MRVLSLVFAGLFLLISPLPSYAWWGHHEQPRIGSDVSVLPAGYVTVETAGGEYFYKGGVYYSRVGANYTVMRPPIGAVVAHIPGYYRKTVVNGTSYYTDKKVYYMRTAEGYRVIAPPIWAK